MRGGIDLGGTKIQAVVVDDGRRCAAGRAARPPARAGRPPWWRPSTARCARRPRRPASTSAKLSGVGVGSPGAVDADAGTVADARNIAGLDRRALPDGSGAGEGRSAPRSGSATTCRWPWTPSTRSAPASESKSLLGVFWGTGVGGGIILDGKPWLGPRRRRRDRPHGGEEGRRALPLRPPRLHGGLCRPRRDGGPGARARGARAARRCCSRSWRSAAGCGCRAASGRARSTAATRWRSS